MPVTNPTHEIRTTEVTVVRTGKPIFDEGAIVVGIDDEAAGEFVTVRQSSTPNGELQIDPGEWPAVREAIDKMVSECRDPDGDNQ